MPKRFDSQHVFENYLRSGINLFLGAGFSVLAKNQDGQDLPIGSQLAEELKSQFALDGDYSLPQTSTILEKTRKDDFYNYIRARFKVGKFDERYLDIIRLNICAIYTTNIDDLIYKIFDHSKNKYLNDVSHNGRVSNDVSVVNYSALHGCVLSEDRKLIFDVSSLNNAYDNSPRAWDALSQDIETTPTLFWGYSLTDTGVIQSLTSRHTLKSTQKEKWIILRKEEEGSSLYYESMGFNIIISDTNDFLNYINSTSIKYAPVKKISKKDEINYLFPKNLIPKGSKGLSVRPISEFIKGNPPIWSDIYSGLVYRTSYFSEIQNKILSKKNNIILGGPVTGKSTLMMQLAAFVSFEGYVFAFNYIDSHKAELLKNVLKNDSALIFVDNFADSIEAFNILSKVGNFTLVGFERGHNYGIVSHVIDEKKFIYTNITELKDIDIQGIYDLLPVDQRKPKLKRPNDKAYAKDSIFEFIGKNVKYPTIEDRYRSALKELNDKNPLLAEFLVLTSYVHLSRVPLSFNMLYSYFSDDIETYADIYHMRDDLKDMVKDYSGDLLLEEDQDYYYPRSMYSAETVLRVANVDLLKGVIEAALDRIPSTNIPYFNIYRKYAYDKNLMLRAFSNWKEGKLFYEKVYDYDFKNPYVLQQGALYLAQKKNYNDAFHWIDRAMTQTHNKYFSIRNSHAIILFEANINSKEENSKIRDELDRSMSILEKCFSDDKRKVFHAIRYAEQTLEYANRYSDEKTKKYIEKAINWLNSEKDLNYWNLEIPKLIQQLKLLQ